MCANLFPRSCTSQRFVDFNVAQTKKMNYYDGHPINQFFFLIIKIFEYLNKQVDPFLHDYANTF